MIKRKYDRHYHENIGYRESDNSQRNRERLKLLLEYRQGGSLLEIGCGMGGFLRLAEGHFNVKGMDVSKYAVEANQAHFGERVQVGNVEQHPLPGGRYDVIAVFNILEHLQKPDKVIERMYKALTAGGVVIGSVPHNHGLVGGLLTRVGNFVDRTHVSTFRPEVWRRLFGHAGFGKIDFFGEVNLGRNHCRYVRKGYWPKVAFNLMFVCEK